MCYFCNRLHFLSVYRGHNPNRIYGELMESLDLSVQWTIGFWLIRAPVISQLFFKTLKFFQFYDVINFQEKWLRARDAASFPYSGNFMCGKGPKHLREMWSFDLLNERLQPIWSRDVHHDCLQSFWMCDHVCNWDPLQFLNFRLKDKSCDLSDAGRHAHPEDYRPKTGCIYMDVFESPKVRPFNIIYWN